jgi:hypothetical protein
MMQMDIIFLEEVLRLVSFLEHGTVELIRPQYTLPLIFALILKLVYIL